MINGLCIRYARRVIERNKLRKILCYIRGKSKEKKMTLIPSYDFDYNLYGNGFSNTILAHDRSGRSVWRQLQTN